MNPPHDERRGTVLLHDVSMLDPTAEVRPQDVITPARLADLMLVTLMSRRATLAFLESDGDLSTLSLLRGALTLAQLQVPADLGNAAVARLAAMVGLDPLADARTLDGSVNVGRTTLRSGSDVAEVLVTVGASARGLEAEVRAVSINGREADQRAPSQLQRCVQCGVLQAATQLRCDIDDGPLVDVEDNPIPGGTIGVYSVLAPLGEGAGGSVFAGEHALLGRPVAIKLMHRTLAANPALARRFLSEARAASRLRHPNVVDVTDFGVLPQGHPYIVMERLVGEPLDVKLDREGPLEPTAALRLAREVALALSAAHASGIAHNDLKPANVIMMEGSTDQAPRLKLIDFGSASVVGTSEELLFGTPGYMPPERICGEPSDGRADLYALGVMLYEMLTGTPPFPGTEQNALLFAHLYTPFPSPQSPFRVLPRAVHRLVSRAGAKKADERHQSAGEMLGQIDQALDALDRAGFRRWLP